MADHELKEAEFWLPPHFLTQHHYEDEFLAKFTHRLTHSTNGIRGIYDGKLTTEINDPWTPNHESRKIATSPQSTLCNAIGGYYSRQATSRGSLNCLSPHAELLYDAAAKEVTKLRQHTGTAFFHFCATPRKPCLNQFKQQHSMKKKQKGYVQYMQQAQRDVTRNGHSTGLAPGLSPSAWPTLRKSHFREPPSPFGSGMSAVFLGNQVTKSERSGTGVFLPRPPGSWSNPSPEISRKKPDAALKHRENFVSAHAQQRQGLARSTVSNNEVWLPQEWTY